MAPLYLLSIMRFKARRVFPIILFGFGIGSLFLPLSAFALTVGPAKMEYSVNPGDIVGGSIFLMNEEQNERTFYSVFEKFTEDEGQKIFLKEESDLAVWIKTERSVTLKPGEQRNIPFRIEVPKDAPPGGHFAVMWWSTAPAGGKTNQPVSIVTRTGILVLLRVSGDIKEEGEVINFSTGNPANIFFSFPINFNVVFQNKGNVHLKPSGKITIKNIFGATKKTLDVNPYSLQILPQSKRGFDVKWENPNFAFGPYEAQLDLTYGESKKQLAQSIWLGLFPLKILIGSIIALFIIFVVIPKGIKRYNRWIVKRARARDSI